MKEKQNIFFIIKFKQKSSTNRVIRGETLNWDYEHKMLKSS